jgi:hypothetical protein
MVPDWPVPTEIFSVCDPAESEVLPRSAHAPVPPDDARSMVFHRTPSISSVRLAAVKDMSRKKNWVVPAELVKV